MCKSNAAFRLPHVDYPLTAIIGQLFSPVSHAGRLKWLDKNPEIRERTQQNWERVCKAYNILSNPALKLEYDMRRESNSQTASRKPQELSKDLDEQMSNLKMNQSQRKQGPARIDQDSPLKKFLAQTRNPTMTYVIEDEDDFSDSELVITGLDTKRVQRIKNAVARRRQAKLASSPTEPPQPAEKTIKEPTAELQTWRQKYNDTFNKKEDLYDKEKHVLQERRDLSEEMHRYRRNSRQYLEREPMLDLHIKLRKSLTAERKLANFKLKALRTTLPKAREIEQRDRGDVQ